MNGAAILVAAFPALLIVGVLLAPVLARRDRSRQLGTSRDSAQALRRKEQREGPEIADVLPAFAAGGDRYFAKWSALQAKFDRWPADASSARNGPITEPL